MRRFVQRTHPRIGLFRCYRIVKDRA